MSVVFTDIQYIQHILMLKPHNTCRSIVTDSQNDTYDRFQNNMYYRYITVVGRLCYAMPPHK